MLFGERSVGLGNKYIEGLPYEPGCSILKKR